MIEHKEWCDSLTKQLLSNPPKPAPCNCGVTKASNDTQQKLLPCPFCGNDAELHTDQPAWAEDEWDYATTYISCECCGVRGPDWVGTKGAIDEWNTRVNLGGWVSVDDRLPDDDDRLILVANANNKTVMSAIGIGDLFIGFGPNGMINLDGITHCMSLPEPPMQNES